MLHDSERNKMYYEGLKAAIALKRSQGQPVHVLDIGTGTGLLSMMAAKIGADSITAIEEFLPMANRAEKIIRDNGFQGMSFYNLHTIIFLKIEMNILQTSSGTTLMVQALCNSNSLHNSNIEGANFVLIRLVPNSYSFFFE